MRHRSRGLGSPTPRHIVRGSRCLRRLRWFCVKPPTGRSGSAWVAYAVGAPTIGRAEPAGLFGRTIEQEERTGDYRCDRLPRSGDRPASAEQGVSTRRRAGPPGRAGGGDLGRCRWNVSRSHFARRHSDGRWRDLGWVLGSAVRNPVPPPARRVAGRRWSRCAAWLSERERHRRRLPAPVREHLQPGTSALFLAIEQADPDKAIAALKEHGGTVIKTTLSDADAQKLQAALEPTSSAAVAAQQTERGSA